MATKTVLEKVLALAGKFVIEHKGSWGHEAWEKFLAGAAAEGVAVTDETKRNLGNILETSKFFYGMGAASAPAKKPAAKAKPKAKSK